MTLRDKRHPRNVLVVVGALSGLTFACNGTIMDGPGGSGPGTGGPGTGGPGTGAPGGPGAGSGDPRMNPNLPQPPGTPACDSKQFTPARVWRLSDDQFVAAVKDLLPGVAVPTILTPGRSAQQFVDFAELFEIGPATTSDIRSSANTAAAEAVKNLDGLLACKTGEAPAACAGRFTDGFASRAFRRPLEQLERDGLKAVYEAGVGVNQAEGIRMVITAVLQSGSFLYRTELGKGNTVAAGQTVELTNHELASSLSFLFMNSIPDPELRAAADDGSLARPDVFKAQVERLLKLPRVQDHLTTVYQKWIGLGLGLNADLAVQEKEFVPALKASMEEEIKLFFKQLLGSGGTVNDLLTSNKGFTDRVLATHMGMAAPTGTGFQPASYPAEQRAGILTLPGVIARYSLGHPEVFRGKFIRDEFLCTEIPPPPDIPEIEAETKASENLPARVQVQRRLDNATCGACHRQMDPIGLSFANYDALGRFKTSDPMGAAIDSAGELTGAGDADGPLKNAVELGKRLARSEKARTCIETKMLGYALGRSISYESEGDIDRCEVRKIDGFVNQGGGKLSDLMAAVVYSSAFRFRTGGN